MSRVCEALHVFFALMRVYELYEIVYVSFALVLVVLSFYFFLRCRLLVRVIDLHMINVEPFLTFLEGSCVLSQLCRAFTLVFGN